MKPNKLQNYIIFVISVLLSSVIGYYCNYYFASIQLAVLFTAILAIVFIQTFELILSQLKQKNYQIGQSQYGPETIKAIEQLQEKISTKLTTITQVDDIKLYVLHWPSKRYLAFKGTDSFSLQHSLVYASQHFTQTIALDDEKYFTQLPEVVALDIKALFKEHQATHAIPLYHDHEVYGFVFVKSQQKKLDPSICELAKHSGLTLEQVLQHDAIVIGGKAIPNQDNAHSLAQVPWQSLVVLILFIALTVWWLISPLVGLSGQGFILDFGNVYGIAAAWGGIWGLVIARQLHQQKNLSLALLIFAIGLLFQEFGQLSYAAYYYLWAVEIPYPSVGDIGFFGSVLFYIAGVLFLAKASGVSLKLRTFKNQLLAVIVPLLMLLIGYLLFLQDYQIDLADPLRVFLDFGYPLFQAIYVSIAILIYLLTRDTKGSTKNQVLLIVIALIWQFICDYTFLYQASRGTWEVNGINDYMYLISYILMSITILQFIIKPSTQSNLPTNHSLKSS